MPKLNSHLCDIMPGVHGGDLSVIENSPATDGMQVLDFSTCCNPYGPPAAIASKLKNVDISSYPDSGSSALSAALSRRLGAGQDEILVTSGSTELLRLASQAYLGIGDTAIMLSPTYGEYALASRIAGAAVVPFQLKEADTFKLDIGSFIPFAAGHHPKAIFLCSPNNPTGNCLSSSEISRVLSAFPDTLVVLDEAYAAFMEHVPDFLPTLKWNNLLKVRSMTKDYALAGLRLGYGLASPDIISNLRKIKPPWSVNSAALAAGLAALECDVSLEKSIRQTRQCAKFLVSELASLGFETVPSETHYFLVKVGDAGLFQRRLLSENCLVRDCASFGLPGYVRIAPRRMPDCRRLIRAIKSITGDCT
jgi:histidinol-phosphate aminotransferase